MELVRVDTQRAYDLLWEMITTLELEPGAPINEQDLAKTLDIGEAAVREALSWLAHENLVEVTPRHGIYVSEVDADDLQQVSEMRLSLESLCARLAAQRATEDDIVVLEALREEQSSITAEEHRQLFDLDHKFHQALAKATKNKYLAQTLDRLFGLSRRLWYLVLPHLEFLPSSVEKHLDLVEAVKEDDADRAEQIMYTHVKEFYDEVHEILMVEDV